MAASSEQALAVVNNIPTTIPRPIYTQTIDQQYFIESQQGSQSPLNFLDTFPESVYTHSLDSVLVTMLYVLLGPAGVGQLRTEYLQERLAVESGVLQATDLDNLYANPLGFARLAEETYEWDASAALLTSQQRAQILTSDANFRNRAMLFLSAIQAGGTVRGISLAAQSGLGQAVDVIENYQALWDQYCDLPLNLEYMGTTTLTNEVVIRPTPDQPASSQQTLTLIDNPASGWFSLSVPLGTNYLTLPVTVESTTTITVPDATQTPVGTYVSLTATPISSAATNPIYFGEVTATLSPTLIQLGPAPGFTSFTLPSNMIGNTYWAYTGYGQTVPLPFNATASMVQAALMALPVVGPNDIMVSDGPLPDLPLTFTFTDQLANTPIPPIGCNINPDPITGITNVPGQLTSLTTVDDIQLTDSSGVVTIDTEGTSGSIIDISPVNEHNMMTAVDQLRPQDTFITTTKGQQRSQQYLVNQVYAGFRNTEVIRYAKGSRKISWPQSSPISWMESGVEHQAPRSAFSLQPQYHHGHIISQVTAYTEAAVVATDYNNPDPTQPPLSVRFWDVHVGAYNPMQVVFYPFLGQYTDSSTQMSTQYVTAPLTDPLIISNLGNGTAVINQEYPVSYLGLPGVDALPTQQLFWSSIERLDGTDYLEIDLGTTQAVNFISFEATRKPYLISLAYDVLDQSPQRSFINVTTVPAEQAKSTTALSYDHAALSPWEHCQMMFTDSIGNMIYTRYLRLAFTKFTQNSPLVYNNQPVPYSIEVRNLRVARHVVPSGTIDS